ncbi:MAG: class I SAM-dependent methyltransferase [Candidatus Shapirobacteria bacterium]|nr:class I SAM-dependent methyltransferase [Candidatus Shapirobacteria bacterium]MDD5482006.1 class I SAM-dependent methyltransferase [Candidatus Shapirobacteria bacterium]
MAEIVSEAFSYFGYGGVQENPLIALRRKIAPVRFELAAKAIVKETGLTPQSKVLEIGCGVGLLGKAIKDQIQTKENHYYGLDLSFDPALKESQKRGLSPIEASATALPFQNESFDAVVSNDVFEHIDNAEQLVEETYRVLRPGGRAFIAIADPSEGRFGIPGHINRTGTASNITYWENLFAKIGFSILPASKKYRQRDWRRIFNLPVLRKIKDKPVLSCCFDIVSRPGVYILEKGPKTSVLEAKE